jgi:hypothetical protein
MDDLFDLDEADDISEEELAELLRHLSGDAELPVTQPPADKTAAFDDAVFKRLFRQTAAALHPDKESDSNRLVLTRSYVDPPCITWHSSSFTIAGRPWLKNASTGI